ncbi:hypothetical protein XELAEV_18014141mg [Xenopus laevis]|uniref:Uncharacterized protein n=1 Tax=Xenopus laevis TaxID=8355 RepID=A0A974DHU9_XENLA|nr:hypothetical protein XELAEV_18014141mg [Xenopus laevis]
MCSYRDINPEISLVSPCSSLLCRIHAKVFQILTSVLLQSSPARLDGFSGLDPAHTGAGNFNSLFAPSPRGCSLATDLHSLLLLLSELKGTQCCIIFCLDLNIKLFYNRKSIHLISVYL